MNLKNHTPHWIQDLKPVQRGTLSQYVYENLLQFILAGKITPGEHLVEQKLADQLKSAGYPFGRLFGNSQKMVLLNLYRTAVHMWLIIQYVTLRKSILCALRWNRLLLNNYLNFR